VTPVLVAVVWAVSVTGFLVTRFDAATVVRHLAPGLGSGLLAAGVLAATTGMRL